MTESGQADTAAQFRQRSELSITKAAIEQYDSNALVFADLREIVGRPCDDAIVASNRVDNGLEIRGTFPVRVIVRVP